MLTHVSSLLMSSCSAAKSLWHEMSLSEGLSKISCIALSPTVCMELLS